MCNIKKICKAGAAFGIGAAVAYGPIAAALADQQVAFGDFPAQAASIFGSASSERGAFTDHPWDTALDIQYSVPSSESDLRKGPVFVPVIFPKKPTA